MQITLLDFITNLLEKGEITVSKDLSVFSDIDYLEATNALRQMYERDALDMSFTSPDFYEQPALWAATYLYRAIQCSLLRDLEAEKVKELLPSYEGEINAESIYSADLMLRYLPDLWNLAKGLAPDDALVVLLRETAIQFPFSSIGIEGIKNMNLDEIVNHASLRQAYVDRILQAEDKERLEDSRIMELAKEVLGNQTKILAPKIKDLFTP